MARVRKKNKRFRAAGLVEKSGAQRSLEEKVDDDTIIAVAKGQKIVERGNDIWIIVDGKPIHWSMWDMSDNVG